MGKLSKDIGNKIKKIRESKGIKQFMLAEKLNMEPSNLTRIENGYQFPKEENLQKIADNLNVKVKELFEFQEDLSKEETIKLILNYLEKFDKKEINFIYEFIKLYSLNK